MSESASPTAPATAPPVQRLVIAIREKGRGADSSDLEAFHLSPTLARLLKDMKVELHIISIKEMKGEAPIPVKLSPNTTLSQDERGSIATGWGLDPGAKDVLGLVETTLNTFVSKAPTSSQSAWSSYEPYTPPSSKGPKKIALRD